MFIDSEAVESPVFNSWWRTSLRTSPGDYTLPLFSGRHNKYISWGSWGESDCSTTSLWTFTGAQLKASWPTHLMPVVCRLYQKGPDSSTEGHQDGSKHNWNTAAGSQGQCSSCKDNCMNYKTEKQLLPRSCQFLLNGLTHRLPPLTHPLQHTHKHAHTHTISPHWQNSLLWNCYIICCYYILFTVYTGCTYCPYFSFVLFILFLISEIAIIILFRCCTMTITFLALECPVMYSPLSFWLLMHEQLKLKMTYYAAGNGSTLSYHHHIKDTLYRDKTILY